MARRRMLSQEITSDQSFNELSLDAQNIYVRMLAVSDDCGVVPATPYTMHVLLNTPPQLRERISELLQEIVDHNLGSIITHTGKPFFIFKPSAFSHHQSYVINKRTKSEYLRMPADMFDRMLANGSLGDAQLSLMDQGAVSESKTDVFQEIPGNSCQGHSNDIDSRKQNAEGRKQKAESKEPRPESLDAVVQLFLERKYVGGRQQAEKFWHHFEANGWVQGKGRAPIRDWRAAAANWNANNLEWGTGGTGQRPVQSQASVPKQHVCEYCGWTGPASMQYRHLDQCPKIDRTGAGVTALIDAVGQLSNRITPAGVIITPKG